MLKKTIYLTLFSLICSCSVLLPGSYFLKTNQKKADQYSKIITQSELKHHLKIISSDEFEGRETTTIGLK